MLYLDAKARFPVSKHGFHVELVSFFIVVVLVVFVSTAHSGPHRFLTILVKTLQVTNCVPLGKSTLRLTRISNRTLRRLVENVSSNMTFCPFLLPVYILFVLEFAVI